MNVPTRAATTIAAIATVRRVRVPVARSPRTSRSAIVLEAISHRPDRLDWCRDVRDRQLSPQVADVDVDDARVDVLGEAPHRPQQLAAGQHLSGMAHEKREEVELRGGEA